eukprot:8452441-Ditylum_brightwellii.AAC.1
MAKLTPMKEKRGAMTEKREKNSLLHSKQQKEGKAVRKREHYSPQHSYHQEHVTKCTDDKGAKTSLRERKEASYTSKTETNRRREEEKPIWNCSYQQKRCTESVERTRDAYVYV